MENVVVHIISHSHWDREWYLPFEAHRMQLVELFDDLFELFEQDPDFNSFHLDGQTIVLEDYLAIRPENRARLQGYIDQGKLKIGPFYILQDDYLISSEANVRNTVIGQAECKKWGASTPVGYFPDTFGNMGQAPQLLKQSGLSVAAFGRGVKPIGFDNQVLSDEQFSSQFSEMYWQGADGSRVLGILFANWYSNGNEIPVEKEVAKRFWEQKLGDVERYASTNQWLLMNGCDHQPVQKNLSEAIRLANELYPEITFIHSSFEEYIEALKQALPEELSTVTGELTSQETDGWYTLANTASSRVYLKQAFVEASQLLEQVVEPLVIMTREKNPKDQLDYAWKLLLQNAPHDSICGCSVDEVHREMESRFAKVQQVGNWLKEDLLTKWKKNLATQTAKSPYLFTVLNTSLHKKLDLVSVDITLAYCDFKEAHPTIAVRRMKEWALPQLVVQDMTGKVVEAKIEDLGANFQYDLPKDAFRDAYMARQVRVTMPVQLDALSWSTFQLVEAQGSASEGIYQDGVIDTPFFRLDVRKKLTLYDKKTNQIYPDFIAFEDRGDIGNEYIYFQPKHTEAIQARLIDVTVLENTASYACLQLTHEWLLPISADKKLEEEQKELVEFMKREAGRSKETTQMVLTTEMMIFADSPQIRFKTRFENTVSDHRIRVLFKTNHTSQTHDAESIFEVVTRANTATSIWENPENPQHQQSFVCLYDEDKGVTISNKGLHEYEILENDTIAVTLLRAVGELGDWGYFPTPEAQCHRAFEVEYAFEAHHPDQRFAAFRRAKAAQVPLTAIQVAKQKGDLPLVHTASHHPAFGIAEICPTAFKVSENHQDLVLRYYNMAQQSIYVTDSEQEHLDLLESPLGKCSGSLKPQEIRTERLKKEWR